MRNGATLAAATLTLLLWAPAASADIEFCPPGEGAGQCGVPEGIGAQRGLAVDTETGRLYVADQFNNRVNVFEADGDFLFAFGWKVNATTPEEKLQTCTTATGCQKGTTGSNPGQFDRPTDVAVDNDPVSPSQHHLYVTDFGNFRVQKLDPTSSPVQLIWTVGEEVDKTDNSDLCTQAEGHTCGKGIQSTAEGGFASDVFIDTGPSGVLYAVDNARPSGDVIEWRLQRFEPSGAVIPAEKILLTGNLTFALAIAVEVDGEFWVTGNAGAGLRKYDPDGDQIAGPFEVGANFARRGLAIDAAGDLYAAQNEGFNVIAAYHPTDPPEVFRRFAYTLVGAGFSDVINGLAAHSSASGEFFFSRTSSGISHVFEPPPGPVVVPPSLEIKALGSAKATAVAEVNPEGKVTEVHFEFLTQAAYEAQGNSFVGLATKKTPTKPLGTADFKLKAAEAMLGCPDPASEAGEAGKCLEPGTTYRWRVVATNADGEGNSPGVEGPSFTTEEAPELGEIWATRVGTDTARLNGEVNPNGVPATGFFEYVDDATYQADRQKAEGESKTPEEVAEASFDHAIKAPAGAPLDFGAGEAFATRSFTIFPLEPGTIYRYRLIAQNPLSDSKISEVEELRTFEPSEVDECSNDASRIGQGAFLPDCRAYEMVSPLDKAGGDIQVQETTLGAPAVLEQSSPSGERLAYGSIRSFGDAASAPFTSQYIARRIEGEEWQTHSINPPKGRPVLNPLQQFDTEFKAFSANLCDAWLITVSEPPLDAEALAGYSNLYRRTDELCSEDGKVHYEALAPVTAPEGIPPGPGFLMQLQGVSTDGTHALFTTNGKLASEGSKGKAQLYESVRGEAPRFACILPGEVVQSGSCTAGSAMAQGGVLEGLPTLGADPGGAMSSDGKRVFWSATGSGDGKLYVRIEGTQTVEISAGKSWLWGSADDGSKAIFSTGSNLFEFEVDSQEPHPIAAGVMGVMGMSEDAARVYFASTEVLSGEEENSNGDKAEAGKANLYLREAGGGIEFVGTLASLDLGPAVSKDRYDLRTARVSPDGGHVLFASVVPLTDYDNKAAQNGQPTREIYRYDAAANELRCLSCNPSGARPAGPSSIPALESSMHGARVLSEDGSRAYFESADALAARDSNGRVDVYQWEEPGTGGCEEADASFSAAAGGCVDLISSGLSPQDSRFVEASPSGEDIFFATGASLLPQDFGVIDIYDARVGGGLPVPPPPVLPCEGDTCHAQIPAPEEPTPASSDYTAPPTAPAGKPAKRRCAKGKRRVSRKGKSRCAPKGKRRRSVR
ncbi:MAG TPA: hypothetical protein VIS95_05235 [Solirubrobacterales bacterium]